MAWMIIEGIHRGKATALGFASGILAGLVAVTPAAGVVQPGGALILGALASLVCYFAILGKNKLGYDDSLDAFGLHGVGGIVGALALVFFIRPSWMAEASEAAGGSWSIWQQFGVQAAAVGIAIAFDHDWNIALGGTSTSSYARCAYPPQPKRNLLLVMTL